mgnify:CR=1 FL=1
MPHAMRPPSLRENRSALSEVTILTGGNFYVRDIESFTLFLVYADRYAAMSGSIKYLDNNGGNSGCVVLISSFVLLSLIREWYFTTNVSDP